MTDQQDLGWLLDTFAARATEVSHAIAISSDGLMVAATRDLPPDRADQLAATGSGLVSLLRGAAAFFDAGAVISNVTQLEGGFMFSMAFNDGASLLVLAAPECDVGKVSYEMTELANRIGDAPDPRGPSGTRPQPLTTPAPPRRRPLPLPLESDMPLTTPWRSRALTAALLAAVLTTSTACGDDAPGTSASGSIKIGLLASLSGTYQAVGTEIRDGFQLYLDTHDGKLGGRQVDLVVADEGNGAQTAVPAATKLLKQDRVSALTGIVGGGSVAGVTPLLDETKVPLVGSNGRPELKDVSRVWHTSYLSDEPGAAIAQHVRDNVKGSVYAIGPDYQGGWDELRRFTDAFGKIGGKLANSDGKTTFTPFPATTNFTPYFARIKASGAAAVYTFYAGSAAVDFVKQYAQSEIKDVPLYAAGFLTEGGVLNAQGEAARDIFSVLQLLARPRQRGEPRLRGGVEGQARRFTDDLRARLVRRGGGAGPGDRRRRKRPDPGGHQRGHRPARPDRQPARHLAVLHHHALPGAEVVPAAGPPGRPGAVQHRRG